MSWIDKGSHVRRLREVIMKMDITKMTEVRESDGEKSKLTLWSFKNGYQLIIRLKAIKSIKGLLCSLSSYINL